MPSGCLAERTCPGEGWAHGSVPLFDIPPISPDDSSGADATPDPITLESLVLRWQLFAFFFAMLFFLRERYLIAVAQQERELALPEALPPSTSHMGVAR